MKQITKIKAIDLDAKLPKGWKYLTSWDCEYLLRNKFELFKKLKKFVHYKLINPKGQNAYVWMRGVGDVSGVVGDGGFLGDCSSVRGVLICKLKEMRK